MNAAKNRTEVNCGKNSRLGLDKASDEFGIASNVIPCNQTQSQSFAEQEDASEKG